MIRPLLCLVSLRLLSLIVNLKMSQAQAQQRSMAQASKALSLCKATMEFSDSRENVECERVLLIASKCDVTLASNFPP